MDEPGPGTASVVIIGLPGLGTDFGGVIALVPWTAIPLTLSACAWTLREGGQESDEGPVPVVGAQRA